MDLVTVLRVAFSLAVVVGLLWLSYRIADRSRRGASSTRGAQLTVVARQGLGAKSAAVLLEADGTRYLLGVTESSVTVIDQGPAPEPAPGLPASPRHATQAVVPRLGPFNVVKSVSAWRSTSPDDVVVARAGDAGASAVPLADDGTDCGRGAAASVVPAAPVVRTEPAGLAVPADLAASGVAGARAAQDGPAATAVTTPTSAPAAASATSGPAAPSFDEAVLAAQAWLGDVPVLAPAGATRASVGVGSPGGAGPAAAAPGLRPGAETGLRALLAGDTWRQAARSVWGPKR
ncbi:FliO/MopB family protein [Oerskovia turbata]